NDIGVGCPAHESKLQHLEIMCMCEFQCLLYDSRWARGAFLLAWLDGYADSDGDGQVQGVQHPDGLVRGVQAFPSQGWQGGEAGRRLAVRHALRRDDAEVLGTNLPEGQAAAPAWVLVGHTGPCLDERLAIACMGSVASA